LLFFLSRRNRWAFISALTVLGATVLLTIFYQIGWSDLIVIALNLIPFILLIKDRAWYLSVESNTVSETPLDQDSSSE
jgi:cytochrome c oxidase subunit IV